MHRFIIPLFFLLSTLSTQALEKSNNQIIELAVTEKGFQPSVIHANPDQDIVLKITRKTKDTCATSIEIPAKKIKRKLPLNKTVSIKIGKLDHGEIKFGCAMNRMQNGFIYVK